MMWPRCVAARALGPASGTRGFRQVSAKKKVATKKQADASGRDPYALFKAAMTAEPDADALAQLPAGHREEHEAARGERSRRMMEQHKRVNGHLARLIRMREQERCPAKPHACVVSGRPAPRPTPRAGDRRASRRAAGRRAAARPHALSCPPPRLHRHVRPAPPRRAARAVASVWFILLFSTSDFAMGWRARRPPIADFEKKMRSRRGDMD